MTTNKFRCVSSCLAGSTADLASKNGCFWAALGCFQDDRRYAKQVFPMRALVLSWQLGY